MSPLGFSKILAPCLAVSMLIVAEPAGARPGEAWIDLVRGSGVRFRAQGQGGWQALPADTCVRAGDQLRVPTGAVIRINYHQGKPAVVKGPRLLTIPRSRRDSANSASEMNLGGFLKLLVSRQKSYHRVGAGTLSGSGNTQRRIDQLRPRFGVVSPEGPLTLEWAPLGRATKVDVSLWRYLDDGSEQRLQRSVACAEMRCRFTVPATFVVQKGVRYHWTVKVTGRPEDDSSRSGVWFEVASTARLAGLQAELAQADRAPLGERPLKRILAYALFGFHEEALVGLSQPGMAATGAARDVRAQLLCLTCRTVEANRVAGRAFCTCKLE